MPSFMLHTAFRLFRLSLSSVTHPPQPSMPDGQCLAVRCSTRDLEGQNRHFQAGNCTCPPGCAPWFTTGGWLNAWANHSRD